MSEVIIYGVLGGERGITASSIKSEIDKVDGTFDVRINSDGGSVTEGLAIYNMLKPKQPRVFIDGAALSMSSVICMAGGQILMPRHAYQMIHDPHVFMSGGAEELRREAGTLDQIKKTLVAIYARRTGKSGPEIGRMMAEETWMNGEECVDNGFADELIENEPMAMGHLDLSKFNRVPRELLRRSDYAAAERKRWVGMIMTSLGRDAAASYEKAISDGKSHGEANMAAISRYGTRHVRTTPMLDVEEVVAGLAYQFDPKAGVNNAYARQSWFETAREIHAAHDRNVDSMAKGDVLSWRADKGARYISNTGMLSTGDFGTAIGMAILRTAQSRYELAESPLRTCAIRRDRQNFQPGFTVRAAPPELTELREGGQLEAGVVTTRVEPAVIRTFGKLVPLSRMALVTDQLNIVRDAVNGAIDAVVQKEEDLLFSCLAPGWDTEPTPAPDYLGQVMSDGLKLFHTTHGNLGTGTALSAATAGSLPAGFEALLDQKEAGDVHFIRGNPRYLLTGPKIAALARVEVMKLSGPVTGNDLQVLPPEPRLLDTTNYYLFADPQRAAALEYGGYAEFPGPQVAMAPAWEVDGLLFKVLHYCGATACDWRPVWRNPGA
jgi:ATP-dependent protease ClpP protease subunit